MATFVKGDIVVLPFPFSDLSDAKRRPTLVVATLPLNDLMLCPGKITRPVNGKVEKTSK
jgi:mRNA interferase MazF